MAIQYQPPGVLNIVQQQAAIILPQISTGQEIPSLVGFSGSGSFPTQLDVISVPAAGSVTTLTQQGVQYNTFAPGTSFMVYNPNTYQTISYGNYYIGTANGSSGTSVTSFGVNNSPKTPIGTATNDGSGSPIIFSPPSGGGTTQYRYAFSYILDISPGTSGLYYETGLGTALNINVTATSTAINLSTSFTGLISYGAGSANFPIIGINVYRSKNFGSLNAPQWSQWNRVYNSSGTSGASAILSSSTAQISYTDLTGNATATAMSYGITVGTAALQTQYTISPTVTFIDTTLDSQIVSNPTAAILAPNPGDTLQVSYQYANSAYYLPTLFTRYADVEAKYGPAFDSRGNVSSQLSFGAKLAVLNGASQFVCTAVSPQDDNSWSGAFNNLTDDTQSTIIVPLSGSSTVQSAAIAHCTSMLNHNIFRTAILGADGASGTVSIATLQANAQAINTNYVQYVSPTNFKYYNPINSVEVSVGGQYAAAALAGMHSARGPADSLTRQTVAGFSSLGDARSVTGANADAGAGLTVIEQKGGTIRVRHDISTAPGNVNTREWPVIEQTYNMLRNILDIYDANVVGKVKSNANGLLTIQNLTSQYLQNLVSKNQLATYSSLSVTLSSSDPTTVNISWTYQPIYTILYININVGINLASGASSVNSSVFGATSSNLTL
jgi:hypothetical protein